MEPLEDAPQDVQDATPVAEELRQAELDGASSSGESTCAQAIASRTEDAKSGRQCCNKTQKRKQDEPDGCCDAKRQRREASEKKTVRVLVHGKPCQPAKIERIPRHCMTRDEYVDFLSTPKYESAGRCVESCARQPVVRRLRVVSPRIDELAKPTRRRVAVTLAERARVMPPEMLERMVELLEAETALTPEQAERLVREQREASRRLRKKKKKRKKRQSERRAECPGTESCAAGRPLLEAGEPSIDAEAARCQYLMAVRFVRSILGRKCEWRRDDYADVSAVILERLARQLEYAPLGCEDRRSQQMRLLADVLACWVTDVLVQLAQRHELRLLADCQLDREAELLDAQSLDDEDDEEESCSDSDDEPGLEELASSCRSVAAAGPPCGPDGQPAPAEKHTADAECQYEPLEGGPGSSDAGSERGEDSESVGGPGGASDVDSVGSDEATLLEEDAAVQTEPPPPPPEPRASRDAATEPGGEQCCDELAQARERLEKVAARASRSFGGDVPFLTFGRIMDALLCVLECLPENALEDRADNRVHRAVFARLELAMRGEPVDARTRDVLDVVAGKLALWIRRTLDQQQIRYLDQHPDAVESRELRDWARWALGLADRAEQWSCWINKVSAEASGLRRDGRLTRAAWASWTGKLETNAMLWRRMYLDSVHAQHFNTMMLAGRPVSRGAGKKTATFGEATIRNTNFDSEPKIR